MQLKRMGKADKEGIVIVDVVTSKEERKLIRDYYERKRCTAKLIQRAVVEACTNYVTKYGKKLELGRKGVPRKEFLEKVKNYLETITPEEFFKELGKKK